MKRFPIFGAVLLAPAIALLVLTGCPAPAPKADKKADASTSDNKDKTDKATAKTKITAPTDGVIKGKVVFDGTPPAMADDPAIAAHKEKDICLAGAAANVFNVKKQDWLFSKDGGVANVVIWLEPAATKEFDIKPDHKKPFEKAVVIDQPFCQYIPHIAAVYADIQPLEIRNDSATSHNVKITPPKINKPTDSTMTPKSKPLEFTYKMEKEPIKLACSIHTWMNAQVHTFNHPYFAVTKDDGTFEIANVPTGEELTIVMWHETKGQWKEKEGHKFVKGANDLSLKVKAN